MLRIQSRTANLPLSCGRLRADRLGPWRWWGLSGMVGYDGAPAGAAVGRFSGPGWGERVAAGQANAARSRWKPSAMWVAQRQVLSILRWSRRAVWVSRAATCRTR